MTSKIYTTITKWTILLALVFGLPQLSVAQNLTISSGGETGTSGTNWSISGNTLTVAASGSADVNASVVANHLNNTGDLTIVLPWQSSVQRGLTITANISYTGAVTRSLIFNITSIRKSLLRKALRITYFRVLPKTFQIWDSSGEIKITKNQYFDNYWI